MLIKPFWPVVEYVVNYDYIVNVLCENKDKPQLNCDGKCYLAKQLAKESEQNNQNPFEKKQSKTEVQNILFYQLTSEFSFTKDFSQVAQNNFKSFSILISKLFVIDISEPPELV
tara:strand:- start:55 stop:396 length:342 start_codon:yes stop_codon:yes gene_type:complete